MAVLFWSAPIWWVPHSGMLELHLTPLQLVAGDAFFLALAVFMAGSAVMVGRRRSVRLQEGDGVADRVHELGIGEAGTAHVELAPPLRTERRG